MDRAKLEAKLKQAETWLAGAMEACKSDSSDEDMRLLAESAPLAAMKVDILREILDCLA